MHYSFIHQIFNASFSFSEVDYINRNSIFYYSIQLCRYFNPSFEHQLNPVDVSLEFLCLRTIHQLNCNIFSFWDFCNVEFLCQGISLKIFPLNHLYKFVFGLCFQWRSHFLAADFHNYLVLMTVFGRDWPKKHYWSTRNLSLFSSFVDCYLYISSWTGGIWINVPIDALLHFTVIFNVSILLIPFNITGLNYDW